MWLRAIGVVAAVAAFVVTGAFGVSSSGTITTIAGSGKQGFSGDGGPAVAAQLRSAYEVAVDRQGNVYIADYDNYRVRRVSPGGTITTFAGTGTGGFSGDGGAATSARLNAPIAIAVDGQGNVYIADFNNARVRKVKPDRDDHNVRRHGCTWLFRGRRSGDLGASVCPARGGGGRAGERLHRR